MIGIPSRADGLCHWYEEPSASYYRNLALGISRQSIAVGGSDGVDMYSVPRPV